MRCDKCQGLVINDAGDVRCLNCGKRPGDAVMVLEPSKEADALRKAITEGAMMPRFTSEEGKQRWLDAMAKRRGLKRGEKAIGGNVPAVVSPKRAENAVRNDIPAERVTGIAQPSFDAILDSAIVQLQMDVDALQRTRRVLGRLQRANFEPGQTSL